MAWPRRSAIRCWVALLLALGCGLIYVEASRGRLVCGHDVLLLQVTQAIATPGVLAVMSVGLVPSALQGSGHE